MSGQLSGGSQKQNGSQSGSQSGSQTGINYGETNQTGVTNTITSPQFDAINKQLTGNLGSTGLNSGQQGALDSWSNYLGKDNNNGLWQMINANNGLQKFTSVDPNLASSSSPVVANQGAAYAGAYQNPYQQQVVNSTIADLSHQNDVGQNNLRAQYGGQGWSPTAGAPAGEQVAAGTAQDNYMRTLASTLGGLNSQGFNAAQGLGAQDASNALQASGQNANLSQNLNMFNAGQNDTADNRAIGALNNISNNAANQVSTGQNAIQGQYNMAGGGNQNLMTLLGLQPTGQSSTSSGNNLGINLNDMFGQNQSTNQSAGSQKGGGIGGAIIPGA